MNELRKAAQELLDSWDMPFNFHPAAHRFEKLRTALAQSERKPLTDQEAKVLWADVYEPGHHVWVLAERFARAIEKAHGIGGER